MSVDGWTVGGSWRRIGVENVLWPWVGEASTATFWRAGAWKDRGSCITAFRSFQRPTDPLTRIISQPYTVEDATAAGVVPGYRGASFFTGSQVCVLES